MLDYCMPYHIVPGWIKHHGRQVWVNVDGEIKSDSRWKFDKKYQSKIIVQLHQLCHTLFTAKRYGNNTRKHKNERMKETISKQDRVISHFFKKKNSALYLGAVSFKTIFKHSPLTFLLSVSCIHRLKN